MAYAAVATLVQSLQQLFRPDHDNPFPLHYPEAEIEAIHEKLVKLQSNLDMIYPVRNSVRPSVTELETQIRDATYKAQDTIEAIIASQSLDPKPKEELLGDLQKILTLFDPITKSAEAKAKEIQEERKKLPPEEIAPETESESSKRDVKIIGQEKDQKAILDHLMNPTAGKELEVVPIVGMPGIGKTTLARSIYEHPRTKNYFDARAWVTVSQDYNVRDIFSKLLRSFAERNQTSDILGSAKKSDDGQKNTTSDSLYEKLYGKKYLIVVDDMWESKVWEEVQRFFPKDDKGSRILLTTRIAEVAEKAIKPDGFSWKMSLLNDENSWKLLCQNAFSEGVCPPRLEASGKEIVKSCGGLPLSLTVVGGLLFKGEKTLEYWKIIAEDTTAAIREDKNEPGEDKNEPGEDKNEPRYKEILYLSYNHLPGKLKGCFLYMGAFREDSEISVSKLTQLWIAEGLHTKPPSSSDESLEQTADNYLQELMDRNLLSARRKTTHGQTRTCGMHDTLRDLAIQECNKESFFHSISKYIQHQQVEVGRDSQRRISIHKNILICMEEVYNSAKRIEHSRTLLYVGPHHHHPVPFVLTFDLLRVLDALTLYFISFPSEILKLIHLRYLALTYNGKIPKTVAKLRNLQVLMVRRYPKIFYTGKSLLPEEIWSMPELRHIFFTESCLPEISGVDFLARDSALLPNLLTLSNVNAVRLSNEVLQQVPNLEKLGIWVEEPCTLDLHLKEVLQKLESLKFTVVNPVPGTPVKFLLELFFPETLKKLTLSGTGIPWKDMEVIAELPNLQVLKLRELSCQGVTWEPETKYPDLKFLLLEALELKKWDADGSYFPALEHLAIRHCYELEEMPVDMDHIAGLHMIELADCSKKAMEWAEVIQKKLKPDDENIDAKIQFNISSSWE